MYRPPDGRKNRHETPGSLIDTAAARIVLLDAAPRILQAFDERLARRAAAKLEAMGVEIRTRALVTGMDAEGVELQADGDQVEGRRSATRAFPQSAYPASSPPVLSAFT